MLQNILASLTPPLGEVDEQFLNLFINLNNIIAQNILASLTPPKKFPNKKLQKVLPKIRAGVTPLPLLGMPVFSLFF